MARAGGITNAVNVGIAVQADWENREFISHISLNVRRLFEFLVQFGIYFHSSSFHRRIKITTTTRSFEIVVDHLKFLNSHFVFRSDGYKIYALNNINLFYQD